LPPTELLWSEPGCLKYCSRNAIINGNENGASRPTEERHPPPMGGCPPV
jgi:hypothetical protein